LFVAGIGASAGGLEALEKFFSHMPEKSDIAIVIIQHLDPTRKGVMPELLQRVTAMVVVEATEGVLVKPNTVYVIPPNKDMSISHGTLQLFTPEAPRGLRLPIDFFLRSLAEDQRERSISIILSGMGSDGTAGLAAIKAVGGLVAVQEPASARFDSMPRSSIEAGLADLVAPPEELPGRIIDYLRHVAVIRGGGQAVIEKEQSSLARVVSLLRTRTGHDFSQYKKSTLYRRIERRMAIHRCERIADYVIYLQENSPELKILFKELLIGVTSFFRDPAEWEVLKLDAIAWLLSEKPAGGVIRAWSVGCSTGEEAYSLAMVFMEVLDQFPNDKNIRLQIFATDLDTDAIDRARRGLYPKNISADVSPERLQRFFVKEGSGYRISSRIRELVIFATQNVIMDPPFTKLDVLLCRNLLIYLNQELQARLLPLFHYSLNPGGILFLGSAETVGAYTDFFSRPNVKSRIFRRSEALPQNYMPVQKTSFFPSTPAEAKESTMPKTPNLQALADQLLLQHFSPPAVLVNDQGDILYINGRTGKYLEPAAGKANWNIFAMVREGLRYVLADTFQRAVRQKGIITCKGGSVEINGTTQQVNLVIESVEKPEPLRNMVIIVFQDVATPPLAKTAGRGKPGPAGSARIEGLEEELRRSHEDLQSTREVMQSSQEELKSMNEELQSTNEELQSANEELVTSKEEMQSMNEELQSVNSEQRSKMDELAQLNNDMNNLLNSTEIATLFLDNELRVRRFTSWTHKLFRLIPGDVGRPLTDVVSSLNYPELYDHVQTVLRKVTYAENQVPTVDGRWFQVRIMPYRTMDNRIDGVVVTCSDISAAKKLETELREEIARLQQQLAES